MQAFDPDLFANNFNRSIDKYFFNAYSFGFAYMDAIYEAGLSASEILFSVGEKPSRAKKIRNLVRSSFDANLRNALEQESMAEKLSNFVKSSSQFARIYGFDTMCGQIMNFYSFLSNFMEPFRDGLNRTPSKIIPMEGRFDLLHFDSKVRPKHDTPILVVGSLINRHYILDLLPKISIIGQFQNRGFDVYATDWRTPTTYDKDLTLDDYAHDYIENAVEKIKEITGSEKVTLFGYCWGGIFSLIYTAMHQENVKNLILHATPTDLENEPTTIEIWTKHLDADDLVHTFGNVPAIFLNMAFWMRSPVESATKYVRYFSEPRTIDEVMEFFAIENWLYDSRAIIGEVFKEIVNNVYKKNLLIKNKMEVGGNLVDLKKITVPFLNIIGERDDLVPPSSSRTVMNVVGSEDKRQIEFPTGHVGLCISAEAHEKLWPDVSDWIAKRSQSS